MNFHFNIKQCTVKTTFPFIYLFFALSANIVPNKVKAEPLKHWATYETGIELIHSFVWFQGLTTLSWDGQMNRDKVLCLLITLWWPSKPRTNGIWECWRIYAANVHRSPPWLFISMTSMIHLMYMLLITFILEGLFQYLRGV